MGKTGENVCFMIEKPGKKIVTMVPIAGQRATTDDEVNRFKAPECHQVIVELRNQEVEFKSHDEIKRVLFDKLDKLHFAHMQKVMSLMAERGVDISRFKLLKKLHKINWRGTAITCNMYRCKMHIRITKEIDRNGNEVFVFKDSLRTNHTGIFH